MQKTNVKRTIAVGLAAAAIATPVAQSTATATADNHNNLCTAVIVSGYDEDMPDSLVGSALAGNINGGMHFVTDRTPPADIAEELGMEGVELVVIVGGTDSVDPRVENDLSNMGFTVHRVAGATRNETADLARAKANEFLTGQDHDYNAYCT